MGASASVRTAVDRTKQEGARHSAMISENALREALRCCLQLSPETIDVSVAALREHARNPTKYPVETEELGRLCRSSEYTRGALHALAAYLVALDSQKLVERHNDPNVRSRGGGGGGCGGVHGINHLMSLSDVKVRPSSAVPRGYRSGSDGVDENDDPRQSALLAGLQTTTNGVASGKIFAMWDMLRRTKSMPSREHATADSPTNGNLCGISNYPTARHPERSEQSAENKSGSGCGLLKAPDTMMETQPELTVKVRSVRGVGGTRPSLMESLGLRTPREQVCAQGCHRELSPPRRAPVRTGHWKLGHEIGKGSFGQVHIGLNEDSGDLIAVKVLSLKRADAAEPLYREIELMRQLTHPNIVCYLGAEVNDDEKTISIFQEWVPGSVTTLLVNFGPFSDHRIAGYTKQILQGLLYLHKERVIHRDIKGGNILIDDRGVVKLCDFGASKMLDAENLTGVGDHTRVGSPLFMAPEILLREEYGPQVDIWSLGGAVLEMATGHPPWQTLNLRTPVALINWVKRTEGPPPLPESLSLSLNNFLLRCFERDPKKRATAKQLLSDPFVAKHQGELPPKVSSPTSDEGSVSDIDNLSRSAAIERIRRASTPCAVDHIKSKPSHNASSVPVTGAVAAVEAAVAVGSSPRCSGGAIATTKTTSHHRLGTLDQSCHGSGIAVTAGHSTGFVQGSDASGSTFSADRSSSALRLETLDDRHPEEPAAGEGAGGTNATAGNEGLSVSPRLSVRTEEDSSTNKFSRPASLKIRGRGSTTPSLRLSTVHSEVHGASCPSNAGGAPRVSTPTRRTSGGGSRANSSSPNPFGGRRRSVESLSPRSSTSRGCSPPNMAARHVGGTVDQAHEVAGNHGAAGNARGPEGIGEVGEGSARERVGARGRERERAEVCDGNATNTLVVTERPVVLEKLQNSGSDVARDSDTPQCRAPVTMGADRAVAEDGSDGVRLKNINSGRGKRPSADAGRRESHIASKAAVSTAATIPKLRL